MERVRLASKEIFIFYFKNGEKKISGCTNKVTLSKKSGIGYENLVRVFTRERKDHYENDDVMILRLRVSDIEKGKQSFVRRGSGGMEAFKRKYMLEKKRQDTY